MAHDTPLGRNTWFQLGGCARHTFTPDSQDDLARLIQRAREAEVNVKVLGAGANVLVHDDGFDGVVVRLNAQSFSRTIHEEGGFEIGAGVDLMSLSKRSSREGWTGLEFMAGIPGTLGGAIHGNAGGRFGEMSDVVTSVRVLDRAGQLKVLSHGEIGFAYRRTALNDAIVLSATLNLRRDDPTVTSRRYDEYLAYKLKTQPLSDRSAGCIFKNPPGASAGALIDRAGLKGTRCGGARVSERHGNFIVAEQGAQASDVLSLIDIVRRRVDETFATELELEIDVW